MDPAQVWQSFSETEKISRLASFEEKYRTSRRLIPTEPQFNLILMAVNDSSPQVRALATSLLGEHFYFRTNTRGDAFFDFDSDVYLNRKPVLLTKYEDAGFNILVSRVKDTSLEVSKAE